MATQGHPDDAPPRPPAAGGDKVLLHFVQKSPGDYAPQESILQALGISAEVCTSEPPEVSPGLGRALRQECRPPLPPPPNPWVEHSLWPGAEPDLVGFR